MVAFGVRYARDAILVALAAAGAVLPTAAAADCTCRALGTSFELGEAVCLATPKGLRVATCVMVLNNTSWQFSDTPCVSSDRSKTRTAGTAH
jgi:hypothetical protein